MTRRDRFVEQALMYVLGLAMGAVGTILVAP